MATDKPRTFLWAAMSPSSGLSAPWLLLHCNLKTNPKALFPQAKKNPLMSMCDESKRVKQISKRPALKPNLMGSVWLGVS